MSRKLIFVGAGLFIMGCAIGVSSSVLFFQRIVTASLSARLLGDLNQDAVMFNELKASDYQMSFKLSKMRLMGTLAGVQAQWPYLTDKERASASRIFGKVKGKDAEVDEAAAR